MNGVQPTLFGDHEPEPPWADRSSAHLVPGLVVLPRWLSESEQAALVAKIDLQPWSTDLSRGTQHYGVRYDYTQRTVSSGPADPLPGWLEPLSLRLAREGHFIRPPEQVIVNEYLPGQGIAGHIDRTSFGPVVATLTLSDGWPMRFERASGTRVEMWLAAGTLAILTRDARFRWRHGIAARKTDRLPDGSPRHRSRRVSVTFRTVGD